MRQLPQKLSRYQDPLTCLLLVAAVLLTFGDVVFHNLNQAFAGLNTGVPNNDAEVLLYPFFDHFIDSLRETGRLDPWNPYVWGGTPAIGNPNVPFNVLLYGLFHLSKPLFIAAMNWHLVAEFCLATTGLYLLCRKLGWGWALSLLGALLGIYSSSSVWLTNTYGIFFHWAVIPWVFLVLLTPERRSRFRSALYLGVIFYFQITYGQAQMTLYSGVFFLVGILWLWREKFAAKPTLKLLALGYGIGLGLALHVVVPQMEFLINSADRQSVDWAMTAARFSVPWQYLLHLVIPRLFWSPVPWWPTWNDGWSPWEAFSAYTGLFFLLLALYSFRHRLDRQRGMIVALVVLNTTVWGGWLLVGLSLGKAVPFSRLTHFLLYPLIFAALGELRIVFASRKELLRLAAFFGVVLLAIVGFSKSFRPFALAFFERTSAVSHHSAAQASAVGQRFLSAHREGLSDALAEAATLVLEIGVLLAMAAFWFRRPWVRRGILGLVIFLAVRDPVSFFLAQRQTGTEPYPYYSSLHPDNPLLEALGKRRPELENYRFSTYTGRMERDTGLAPNLHALSRIPSVNGYMSFLTKRRAWEPEVYRGNWGYVYPESAAKLAGIRYILVGPETPAIPYADKLKPIARHREYVLLEYEGAQPLFYFSQVPVGCQPVFHRTAGVSSDTEFIVDNPCSVPVTFAFQDRPYPWWRFSLDGAPAKLFTVTPAHRGVDIPPGSHRFTLRCVPVSWYVGMGMSGLVGLGLLLIGLWLSRPWQRFRSFRSDRESPVPFWDLGLDSPPHLPPS